MSSRGRWALLALAGAVCLDARWMSTDDVEELGALQIRAAAGAGAGRQELRSNRTSWVPEGRILSSESVSRPLKWHGVNYGNRFVPEDWMEVPYKFFDIPGLTKYGSRFGLWDLSGPEAKQHMLKWLDDTIREKDFEDMAAYGMDICRLPVGYWNFVTYPGDEGPEVPPGWDAVGERLKNLHRLASPEEYRPYLDRAFSYAKKHGIKILLDLHGLPGSQNGEIHSGAVIEEDGKNKGLFMSEANKQMALQTISAMAEYVSAPERRDALFGVQVINEPHFHTDEGHAFLKSYYEQAVRRVREFLPDPGWPVVLFEWTFDMHKWKDNAFPAESWGTIIFDAHLYHFPGDGEEWKGQSGLEAAKESYSEDLQQLRSFTLDKGNPVIVGEYCLAAGAFSAEESAELAQWLVDEFDFAASGSCLWTFDNQHTGWGMQQQAQIWGLDWSEITRKDRDPCVPGPHISLKAAAEESSFLSAREDGSVAVGGEDRFWEKWSPCYYKNDLGFEKVAFRSEAWGGWLSVTPDGQVRQAWTRSAWEEFSVPVLQESGQTQTITITSSGHGGSVESRGHTAIADPNVAWTVTAA
mmetsp:Transcript_35506/g.81970  ORF Transcript_35506/g.81970 Transcript_35506/m.81970 type:complete len:581 (+) Transcript_35506:42-1784(+)